MFAINGVWDQCTPSKWIAQKTLQDYQNITKAESDEAFSSGTRMTARLYFEEMNGESYRLGQSRTSDQNH